MSKAKSEKFNFGDAYKELEGIIDWFEKEEVDLEEGLKKFERGLELAKKCKERLKDVENKVTEIKAKFSQIGDEGGPQEDDLAV